MPRFVLMAAAAFTLTACGAQSPEQQRADQLRDQADAEADAIEAAAENQTAQMKVEAEGLVNQALVGLGFADEPVQLLNTRFAVYVGMVHVLLPFMILPL